MRREEASKQEKSYYVRVINPLHYVEVLPKNACKIGIIKKVPYVVLLNIVDGKEEMKIHTLLTDENCFMEEVEGEVARELFRKMWFF